MGFQINTPGQIIEKVKEYAGDLFTLNTTEVIQRIISAEAVFAVLIEAVERIPDDSFALSTITPTPSAGTCLQTSADRGLYDRFFGYLVIVPDKVQLYTDDWRAFCG
jgi:hypothetical protein